MKHIYKRFSMINLKRKSFSGGDCHNIGKSRRNEDLWHFISQASNEKLRFFSSWQVLLAAFPSLSSSTYILLHQQWLRLRLRGFLFLCRVTPTLKGSTCLPLMKAAAASIKAETSIPKRFAFLYERICTAADYPFTCRHDSGQKESSSDPRKATLGGFVLTLCRSEDGFNSLTRKWLKTLLHLGCSFLSCSCLSVTHGAPQNLNMSITNWRWRQLNLDDRLQHCCGVSMLSQDCFYTCIYIEIHH